MREGVQPVGRLVCELHDIIDLDNESAIAAALFRRVVGSTAPVVVVDVHSSLMTSNGLRVLLRLRALLLERGRVLWVVARQPMVRRVFRACRLDRTLRVVATPAAVRDHCPGPHCSDVHHLVRAAPPRRARRRLRDAVSRAQDGGGTR
ncbi:STAS domain-containing protein [Streptomyces sp. NPDC050560]|uniref:STAS domain-containing protein n=1 Tax=Streptomyces sp. NPDC050560 TaxID=3365630 RepID=UPI0037A97899